MNNLYLNNFRGFTNTYLPFKKVNFFVGENSTGKTSILSLVDLLSDFNFWFYQIFSTKNTQFVSFEEIVSKDSENRKYFQIGLSSDDFLTQTKVTDHFYNEDYKAVLMTFRNDDGIPKIQKFNYVTNAFEIHCYINEDGNILYKANKTNLSKDIKLKPNIFIDKWVSESIYPDSDYNTIKEPKSIPFPFSGIANLRGIIEIELSKEYKEIKQLGGLQIPTLFPGIRWMGPIRAKPQRTYDSYNVDYSSEGSHIPYLLSSIVRNKNNSKSIKVMKLLLKFGKESGLFDSIEIKPFGDSKFSPFELDVVLNQKAVKLINVGYGVSQILPILTEILYSDNGSWFAIQQPEIHLHPKAQAFLGELIFTQSIDEDKRFIIETHSDHIIDRFRIASRNYRLSNNLKNDSTIKADSQVIFFERDSKGNKLYSISILPDGNYSKEQPESFRDFFLKEELNLLGFIE